MAFTADLIQAKLKVYFDQLADLANDGVDDNDATDPEINGGALLERWKRLEGLTAWEDYVAEVFSVSTVDFFPDAENQYWTAF